MWRKTHWVIWILGTATAWLSYSFLKLVAKFLRPDFQPHPLHFEPPTLERLGSILILVLVLAIVFAVHELVHAVFLWFFTGHCPILVIGEGGFGVQLPSWYLPRNQFLITNLAPFCVISLVGSLLLLIVPQRYINLTVFLTAMNMAGSIADIASSVYLFLHSPSIYLETDGSIYFNRLVGTDSLLERKLRIRSLIEAAIAKLDPINGAG